MIWRNLLRRPVRTGLTTLGVSVGLALIVALGAIAEGYSQQFTAMVSSSGAHLTVMQANSADMALSAVDEQAGRKIAAIPGVASVAGMLFSAVPLQGMPYFLIFGHDPEAFSFAHFKIVEGKRLSPRAAAGQSREIMLGRTAAASLKKRVGETVKLYNTPYRIVAIYETGISFEEGAGVISLREAQRIFRKPHQVSMYGVKLDHPDQIDRVRRQILERVDDVTVSRSAEFAENTQDIQVTRAFVWGISAISVLAGGIGMMNTVLMSVFERTREIGVLRALGWRRRWVLALILQESLLLSLLGAVAGSVLGVGLAKLITLTPVGTILPTVFTPRLFLQVAITALILGAVGGFYPAFRAANLRPVEALHYE